MFSEVDWQVDFARTIFSASIRDISFPTVKVLDGEGAGRLDSDEGDPFKEMPRSAGLAKDLCN